MLRTLWNLQRVDPGFRADGMLTFRLQTTAKHRSLATGLPYLEQVVERVSALPGVIGVGAVALRSLMGGSGQPDRAGRGRCGVHARARAALVGGECGGRAAW